MNPEIRLALMDAADNALGIYCAEYNGQKRTEWQDGWNACQMARLNAAVELEKWFNELPPENAAMIGELLVAEVGVSLMIDGETKTPFMALNTSDLFAWGYSNWDKLDGDDLKAAYEVWRANGSLDAWWCRHENEKPQWPVEQGLRKAGHWTAEMEALPDCRYDAKVRWIDGRTRLDAVAKLGED